MVCPPAHPAVAQHDDTVRERHGFHLVMSDVDRGGTQFPMQLCDLHARLSAQRRIQVDSGSSNRNTLGDRTIARPIATRCR